MPEAYFIKAENGMSLNEIVEATKNQILNKKKKLKYNSIVEIVIESVDFDYIIGSVAQPHAAYSQWTPRSIPNEEGIWNCITLKCKSDAKGVIIYTAGRTFPLYISMDTDYLRNLDRNRN